MFKYYPLPATVSYPAIKEQANSPETSKPFSLSSNVFSVENSKSDLGVAYSIILAFDFVASATQSLSPTCKKSVLASYNSPISACLSKIGILIVFPSQSYY